MHGVIHGSRQEDPTNMSFRGNDESLSGDDGMHWQLLALDPTFSKSAKLAGLLPPPSNLCFHCISSFLLSN